MGFYKIDVNRADKRFANPTRNYLPVGNAESWYGALSSHLDSVPIFTWFDVPRMMRDERIQLCFRMIIAPLHRVKWKIVASSPAVAKFANDETKSFWKKYVTRIVRRYLKWGCAPLGWEYHVDDGHVRLKKCDVIEPNEARPLEWKTGARRNEFAGFQFPGGCALQPYAAWFAGEAEINRYWDWPRLRGAYQPWLEKNGRTGAKHSRRLAAVSGWDGGLVRFPLAPVNIGTQDAPEWIDGQTYAMELIAKKEAGSRLGLPNTPNLASGMAGKYAWEHEPGKSLGNLEWIMQYPKSLDSEIDSGMGVPTEVIQASENGGQFGRSIPAEAFYSSEDELVGALLETWSGTSLKHLIRWNFGEKAYATITPQSLVETILNKSPGPQGAPASATPGGNGLPNGQGRPPGGGLQPEDLFGGGGDAQDDGNLSADDGAGIAKRVRDEMGKGPVTGNAARKAVILAMLRIQHEATAGGNPRAAEPWLDELAELANDPERLALILGHGKPADLAWSEDGVSSSGKKRWIDSDTGKRRYQESKPGSRAEARALRQSSDVEAHKVLGKVTRYEATAEDVESLSHHLPAASLEKLRYARQVLGASFGGARRRREIVDSLLTHVAERVRGQRTGEDSRDDLRKPAEENGMPPAAPESGKVYNVNPNELRIDPERFQFKLNTDNPAGVTDELKGVKYNPDFAGVISVWKDPTDGHSYVINGHHRHDLAKTAGVDRMAVRYLDASSPAEARGKGALINIAGGRGTAVDAAKFMRDTGVGIDQFKEEGVSLKGNVARDAVVLAKLADPLFNRVVKGTLDEARAMGVAQNIPDAELQLSFLDYLEKAEERKGNEVAPKVVASMAQEWAHAPTRKKVESTLFGEVESNTSLFLDRHELKTHAREQLAKEERDFAAVASERRAGRVAEEGNTLATDKNRQRAETAGRLKTMLDQADPRWSDILDKGAEEYADATTRSGKDKVKRDVAERIRAALSEAHAGTISGVDDRSAGTPGPGPVAETAGGIEPTEAAGTATGELTGDVTVGGASESDSDDGPAMMTTEESDLRTSINEGETILRGDIAGDKRDAVQRSVDATKAKLAALAPSKDLFGRELPKSFAGKKGTQLDLDDRAKNLWMEKAHDHAAALGGKVSKFGFFNSFHVGDKEYEVGKAGDGYPITEKKAAPAPPKYPGDAKIADPHERVKAEPAAFVEAYLKAGNGSFNADGELEGVTINTDEARPLFEEYRGTNSADVHEASSEIAKRALAKALVELRGKRNNRVLVLAGGGGSGKGTAVKGNVAVDEFPIVLDQTSDNYPKLQSKFAEAVSNGFTPEYSFVDRHPTDAWDGVVSRAVNSRMKGLPARTVPLEMALHANIKAREVAIQVLKGNPEVDASIIDNNRGPGFARLITDRDEGIRYLEAQNHDHAKLLKELKDATHARHARGELPDDIRHGLIGPPEASVPGLDEPQRADGVRGDAPIDAGAGSAEGGTDGGGGSVPKRKTSFAGMTQADVAARRRALEAEYVDRVGKLGGDDSAILNDDRLREIEADVERHRKRETKLAAAVPATPRLTGEQTFWKAWHEAKVHLPRTPKVVSA